MLKIKHILFLIIGGIQLIQAQSYIEGSISDHKGKIPFANIQIKNLNIGTAADAEGHFKIQAPAGDYSLEVTAMGYHKFKKKIKLTEGDTIFIDPVLSETSYSIDQIVVTGTLKEAFVKVSPVKVEVISSAFVKKNTYK